MNYIIEGANVVSEEGITISSFLIHDHKISHYGRSLKQYQGMRMKASDYIMTPGHVYLDFQLVNSKNLEDYKSKLVKLVTKGCTTVLVPCEISYESEFENKVRAARHSMINSTIDFVIGIRIAAEKLTPSIIRLCKRHKIPYILADVNEDTNIHCIPWGWIREAQFQFQIPIYPLWNIGDKKELKIRKQIWEEKAILHNITTYLNFPIDFRPVPKVIRQQIGIYPKKGELLIGNDLDYNLYAFPLEEPEVEEKNKLDYDKIEPLITVHKGKVLKVNGKVNFFPGFGQELIIKIPGLFAAIETVGYRPHPTN